jgi:hypothetical protein
MPQYSMPLASDSNTTFISLRFVLPVIYGSLHFIDYYFDNMEDNFHGIFVSI